MGDIISFMPQSLAKNYIHLVFATRGRTETIPKVHFKEIHAYVAKILNNSHCPVLCVGGTTNHIHILFILSKTMTLSDTVRIVKAHSSKWINEKNSPLYPFCWQDGYGAFSISQGHIEAVKQYIDNQEEHHKGVSFEDEFRKICKMYNVDLDERYVWD